MQAFEVDMAATWTGGWSVVVQTLRATAAICGGYSANAFTRRYSEENTDRLVDEIAGTSLPEDERGSSGKHPANMQEKSVHVMLPAR